MRTSNIRHQFYLPRPLSEELARLTTQPGATKTSILTDALTAWFERRGASELDERFGARLDRTTRTLDRLEKKLDLSTELLGVFVQHQLTLVAGHPPFTAEAQHAARDRFVRLLDFVEQRLGEQGEASVIARALVRPERKANDAR